LRVGEPSHTARGAAAYRAIHQALEGGAIFSDPFAAKILDDETHARLAEMSADPSLRPMRLFVAARSRFLGRLSRDLHIILARHLSDRPSLSIVCAQFR